MSLSYYPTIGVPLTQLYDHCSELHSLAQDCMSKHHSGQIYEIFETIMFGTVGKVGVAWCAGDEQRVALIGQSIRQSSHRR